MTPQTDSEGPLILTLRLDDISQESFERLRRTHFPPERNVIPAHLSLFQQLPGERLDEILADLDELCRRYDPLVLEATGLRFLGRGVAYVFESSELDALRSELARRWEPLLEKQDRQGFRAHVTVQNKVPEKRARALHEQLAADFERLEVRGEGLLLWRYLGGPWEQAAEVAFGTELQR